MKKLGIYCITVLIITILLPTVIVRTFNFLPKKTSAEGKGFEREPIENKVDNKPKKPMEYKNIDKKIRIYNPRTEMAEEMDLEEYIKGVVAAEMPAAFHIEALKAQAVAARTYALSRNRTYSEGHPDHIKAPLCTAIHCQAYLSLEQLETLHGSKWIEDYWGKIEESVDSTRGLLVYYNGEIIETPYHSTSGGMTEDSVDVFSTERPYLKAVSSPYEEDSPRFKSIITLTQDEFIQKLKGKYPKAQISKENFFEKIRLIERTPSGRIKRIAIDNEIVDGREIRDLFQLNSTNFIISFDKKLGIIEIQTRGYGHGVGMSQWGANGMAKNGSNYMEILKHYYTDVEIKQYE